MELINPFRKAFGNDEEQAVYDVIQYYRDRIEDPPYDGFFQKKFEEEFSRRLGSGFSKAVSSGTNACFIALRCLDLKKNSEVSLSPVTDSGSLFAIIECGLKPVVVDSANENTFIF